MHSNVHVIRCRACRSIYVRQLGGSNGRNEGRRCRPVRPTLGAPEFFVFADNGVGDAVIATERKRMEWTEENGIKGKEMGWNGRERKE